MDTDRPASRPVPSKARPFVAELVPLAGQLHVVLEHMEAFRDEGAPGAGAAPVADVLAALLEDVLAPLARRRPADLARAASVLRDVSRAVEEGLYLVPRG